MHGLFPKKAKKVLKLLKLFENWKGCKPSKIWLDKVTEFNKSSMKSWLQDNNIGIYSTHNEGKPAVVEQFIQGKAYKYLNSV